MAKLDFYAEVHIRDAPATTALGIAGSTGAILGISEGPHGTSYAITVDGKDETFMVAEPDLVPTGKHFTREDFYSGVSLGVPPERYTDDEAETPDEKA